MAVPTRLIIVLSRHGSEIGYVLRADVPAGQEAAYATLDAVSPTGNVSDPDLPGLVAGTIAQTTQTLDLPQQANETVAQYRARVQSALIAQQVGYQARVNAAVPRAFFGAYYTGSAWQTSGG